MWLANPKPNPNPNPKPNPMPKPNPKPKQADFFTSLALAHLPFSYTC